MRRARPLVFCVLALAFAFPALSQTPSDIGAFTTATCGKPVCTWNAFGPQTFTRETGKPAMSHGQFRDSQSQTRNTTMFVQKQWRRQRSYISQRRPGFGPSNFNPNVATSKSP